MVEAGSEKQKGKGKMMDTEEEDAEWGIGEGDRATESPEPELDEEEEAMNGPKKVKVLEEENESHRPHEPLVSVLQKYSSVRVVLESEAS
jgi:hypothetical protein